MLKTKLNKAYTLIITFIYEIVYKKLGYLSFNFLNTLLGFFIASSLATIPGQTGDWGITGSAIIVSLYEIISLTQYSKNFLKLNILRPQVNNIKIGILYGFLSMHSN